MADDFRKRTKAKMDDDIELAAVRIELAYNGWRRCRRLGKGKRVEGWNERQWRSHLARSFQTWKKKRRVRNEVYPDAA
jgi:hypothetical protein